MFYIVLIENNVKVIGSQSNLKRCRQKTKTNSIRLSLYLLTGYMDF